MLELVDRNSLGLFDFFNLVRSIRIYLIEDRYHLLTNQSFVVLTTYSLLQLLSAE